MDISTYLMSERSDTHVDQEGGFPNVEQHFVNRHALKLGFLKLNVKITLTKLIYVLTFSPSFLHFLSISSLIYT
jgi:hypothetical protein